MCERTEGANGRAGAAMASGGGPIFGDGSGLGSAVGGAAAGAKADELKPDNGAARYTHSPIRTDRIGPEA